MLIRKIEKFLRRTGMTAIEFGRVTMRDPRFVADLRRGREPRFTTESQVEHFMNTFQDASHAS